MRGETKRLLTDTDNKIEYSTIEPYLMLYVRYSSAHRDTCMLFEYCFSLSRTLSRSRNFLVVTNGYIKIIKVKQKGLFMLKI